MSTFRNLLCLGLAAAAVSAAPALASTTATSAASTTATHAATTHPATAAHVATATHATTGSAARPTASVARPQSTSVSHSSQAATRVGSNGRFVRTRLSNGQYVTLNCSLAGNQNKQACRR